MNIAIVGGGFTGLTAAYDLSKSGHKVTLYESNLLLGGLAAGFKDSNWQWSLEHYYHHIFSSDRQILDFIAELGYSSKVIFKRPLSVATYLDKFYPLDSPSAILKFPGLSYPDKIRFGLVTAYLKYLTSWPHLEKTTAKSWLTYYYGLSVYRTIWEPLLVGKFGSYAHKVNMAWMWARLKARTPSLGTYHGGFSALILDLKDQLIAQGVTLKLNQSVKTIKKLGSGLLQVDSGQHPHVYDQVLLTVPPPVVIALVPELPSSYKQTLTNLKHLGAMTIILALKRPLSPQGYYWYNLHKTAKMPFLALVEHTNFVPARYFNHDHLVYIGDYAPSTDRRFYQEKSTLVNLTLPLLKTINSGFDPSWIRKSWVNRTTYAQPIPEVNHSTKLPSLKTPIPGLFLACMSQVYPWDRGTNFAVDLGHRVAGIMNIETSSYK